MVQCVVIVLRAVVGQRVAADDQLQPVSGLRDERHRQAAVEVSGADVVHLHTQTPQRVTWARQRTLNQLRVEASGSGNNFRLFLSKHQISFWAFYRYKQVIKVSTVQCHHRNHIHLKQLWTEELNKGKIAS